MVTVASIFTIVYPGWSQSLYIFTDSDSDSNSTQNSFRLRLHSSACNLPTESCDGHVMTGSGLADCL
jgi:hypothetical protein